MRHLEPSRVSRGLNPKDQNIMFSLLERGFLILSSNCYLKQHRQKSKKVTWLRKKLRHQVESDSTLGCSGKTRFLLNI